MSNRFVSDLRSTQLEAVRRPENAALSARETFMSRRNKLVASFVQQELGRAAFLREELRRLPLTFDGSNIYRFFKEPGHADALVAGKVWISTLGTCRRYENSQQGDPEEGFQHYRTGDVRGGGDDVTFVEIANRAGIVIGPGCSNGRINVRSTQSMVDAFVVCTTERFDPAALSDAFGHYCVKISRPRDFFEAISTQIRKCQPITGAYFQRVIYTSREFTGMEPRPGPAGFVKPPDVYGSQHEVRLLWESTAAARWVPFELDVPLVSGMCERIA